MAYQMAQEGALWSSAMIRLGPHWHKVNELALLIVGYNTYYCYSTITDSETKLYGTINNYISSAIS